MAPTQLARVPEVGEGADGRTCPWCGGATVDRLFVASVRLDACECQTCRARWDEDTETGVYRGRSHKASVLAPRDR